MMHLSTNNGGRFHSGPKSSGNKEIPLQAHSGPPVTGKEPCCPQGACRGGSTLALAKGISDHHQKIQGVRIWWDLPTACLFLISESDNLLLDSE